MSFLFIAPSGRPRYILDTESWIISLNSFFLSWLKPFVKLLYKPNKVAVSEMFALWEKLLSASSSVRFSCINFLQKFVMKSNKTLDEVKFPKLFLSIFSEKDWFNVVSFSKIDSFNPKLSWSKSENMSLMFFCPNFSTLVKLSSKTLLLGFWPWKTKELSMWSKGYTWNFSINSMFFLISLSLLVSLIWSIRFSFFRFDISNLKTLSILSIKTSDIFLFWYFFISFMTKSASFFIRIIELLKSFSSLKKETLFMPVFPFNIFFFFL